MALTGAIMGAFQQPVAYKYKYIANVLIPGCTCHPEEPAAKYGPFTVW